jgi:hypothetical protein
MRDKSLSPEAIQQAVRSVEAQLPYSPLTASIAVLGLYDVERDTKAVYCVGDSEELSDSERVVHSARSEAELLHNFWAGAPHYDTFVSFNGRRFLLPFLLHRSALNGITPSVTIPLERTIARQGPVQHIDLLDQLTFMGATRRHSLYHYCHAYQLPLPAVAEVSSAHIAVHNGAAAAACVTETVTATASLYSFWRSYFRDSETIYV